MAKKDRTIAQILDSEKRLNEELTANVCELMDQSNRNRSLEELLMAHGFECHGGEWRATKEINDALRLSRLLEEKTRQYDSARKRADDYADELRRIYRKLGKLISKSTVGENDDDL